MRHCLSWSLKDEFVSRLDMPLNQRDFQATERNVVPGLYLAHEMEVHAVTNSGLRRSHRNEHGRRLR
jgi:hypothetical protein